MKLLGITFFITSLCLVFVPTARAEIADDSSVVISQVATRFDTSYEELIELYNNSDEPVDVTDWCLQYGTTLQKERCFESEDSHYRLTLAPRSYIVLVSNNFASAYLSFGYDFTMPYGLSDGGGRVVLFDNEDNQIDAVAWGTSAPDEGTTVVAAPVAGEVLQRKTQTLGALQDTNDNDADFEITSPRDLYSFGSISEVFDECVNITGLQTSIPEGFSTDEAGDCIEYIAPETSCLGVLLSEILPNAEGADTGNEFIELYNPTEEAIVLDYCSIELYVGEDFKASFVFPTGTELAAGEYLVLSDTESGIVLPNASGGILYLIDTDMSEIDVREYPGSLDDGVSWAFVADIWQTTYMPTAGETNAYQPLKPCPAGQERSLETGYCRTIEVVEPASTLEDCGEGRERNPETNRCRNIPTESQYAPCKAGQYRSEETNRCRSIASAASAVLQPCGEGQFRNPATNRCKKIASTDDLALADCGEGRERNPETNRCRNVVATQILGTTDAIELVPDSKQTFVGWWSLGGIVLFAGGYALWEWRAEVASLFRKIPGFGGKN